MKKLVLLMALIAAFALITVPAVAGPPIHRVTFTANAISTQYPEPYQDPSLFVGHHVDLHGAVLGRVADPDNFWDIDFKGQAVFEDNDLGLKAQFVIDSGGYCPAGDYFEFFGDTYLTVNGVKSGPYYYMLYVDRNFNDNEYPQKFSLHINQPDYQRIGWHVIEGFEGSQVIIK